MLGLSEEEFRARFRGTALIAATAADLLRNAALVLGNAATPGALPALRRALDDAEPLVREAAAWAIARIEAAFSRELLRALRSVAEARG